MAALRPSVLEGPAARGGAAPSRLKLVLLGVGLFLFALPHFAIASFPYDHLAEWIAQEVEAPRGPGGKRRPSGWLLEIAELSPRFPLGLQADGVTLARPVEGGPRAELFVPEASVDLSPLSLLLGTVAGTLEASLAGGSVQAEFSHDAEEGLALDVTLEGIRLRRLGILRAFVPVPVRGTLGGTVELSLPPDPSRADGRIELRIQKASVGDGQAKLPVPGMADGITLERVEAGDLVLRARIEEGLLRIEELKAHGPDVQLDVLGTIRLARRLRASRLDLMSRVAFSDAFRNRSDRTRAIFSLLEFSPQLRRARTKDEALQWRITGTLGGRVSTRPAGSQRFAAPGGKKKAARKKGRKRK